MFQTGRRTIFEVCRPHCGHRIEMLDVQEEGVVKGIKVYCRTCATTLLAQETEDYDILTEIATRKSRRVGAMNYEQWESNFFSGVDMNCECGDCGDCMAQNYEGSELSEFYRDYLSGFDAPEPTPRHVDPWDTGQTPVRPVAPATPQNRDWNESRPEVPESQGWDAPDTGWST